ncbi:MAG: hypothetical protein L3J35_09155 [Bacteroidales bacterium]|nr:hypothetical protein [Bacteroidales bacterium]
MFNNKALLVVSVIAVAAVLFVSVYFGKEKRQLSPLINAIPNKAAFIIETEDFSYLTKKITKNKDIEGLLSNLELTKNFKSDFLFIDSLIRKNNTFKNFLNKKTVIFSAHLSGQKDVDFLFSTGFSGKNTEKKELNDAILSLVGDSKLNKISFAGAEIYNQKYKSNKFEVFYTFYEDYFLLSRSEILIQQAIKNINSGASYFSDNNFKSLYQENNGQNDATIYINYKMFFKFINYSLNSSFKDEILLLQRFADWSAFDLTIKRKEIIITGHTNLKPEMQYLSLFKDVNPKKSKTIGILPEKTSSFLILNIGSGSNFKYKYEEYLGGIRQLNNHQIQLASFNKKYNLTDDENTLYELTSNEISFVYEDYTKTGAKQNRFIFIKYNNKTKAEIFFNKLIKTDSEEKKTDTKTYHYTYSSNGEEYKIKKIPEKNLPEMYFGVFFKDVNAEYVTFINDFMVFGENIDALKSLIDSYEKDKTFKRKSQNYSLIKSFPDQSNIFFYIDLFHSKNAVMEILNKNKKKLFDKDATEFISVQGPAIQFISDSYPIYTTIKLSLNAKKQQISETVWEVRLDTLIATKPQIVLNHNTLEKEIVVQDVADKIYLIDKNGKIIWTRQLDGRIISNIYQIDFYENNKLQLIFNTKNKIYCIDRKGNWLDGYPVVLKSPATNGISIFDYDQDKNYRIFVATKNKKVSLYNKEGKIIEGWNFKKTENVVAGKIKHFRNKDKDYIVFRDNSKLYILNRKGEKRVSPEANIPLSEKSDIYFSQDNSLSKAHFSVTNPSGTVYSIFENGKIKKETINSYSKEHFYSYKDINGDKIPDYIFTDKNQTEVYNGLNKKRIFTYSYDENLINDITIYKFDDKDIRIGTGSKNKIYLINSRGRLCKGFPLIGSGLFSITRFDEDDEFSLIVGNKDNYLYKYQIK